MMRTQRQTSAYRYPLNHASPLDSLARGSSAQGSTSSTQRMRSQLAVEYNAASSSGQSPTRRILHREQPPFSQQPSPNSPLLHSRFARDSTATASSYDNNSFLDMRESIDMKDPYPDIGYPYHDDYAASVYSDDVPPAIRDSWQSGSTIRHHVDDYYLENANQSGPDPPSSPNDFIPTVTVSSADMKDSEVRYSSKAPITRPMPYNFSRPVRPTLESSPELTSEERKQMVLERNARASPSRSPAISSPLARSQSQLSVINTETSQPSSSPNLSPAAANNRSPVSTPPSSSSSRQASFPNSPVAPGHYLPSPGPSVVSEPRTPGTILLPRRPPSLRADSPTSVYSTYSFYQLDSPSPTGSSTKFTDSPQPPAAMHVPQQSPLRQPSPASSTADLSSGLRSAEYYLQLGIQHHEANRLRESAACFEKSATEHGGSPVGMLMWGLTLRHGWGCKKDEKNGFKWLQRAAEHAVHDLEGARAGGSIDPTATQSELILAVYEVGQCFFHGWGVAKDQKMAVSYYTVAARLGDADAQNDLAFCLANGKGCKKDRKAAAKWYRDAVAQGMSDVGLAWIYKEKFQ